MTNTPGPGSAYDVVDDAAELAQFVHVVDLVSSSTWPASLAPHMPRFATRMPVAFATIACSNEIFVPSAKLVTMWGFWPHFWAKPSCVVGLRYGSCRPLMLPHTSGVDADALHESVEVHLHAGLVAVACREDHAVLRPRRS